MKKLIACILLLLIINHSFPQDPWIIKAGKIDPSDYYGITVANGMIGIVSSPQPFQVKDVVLAGAYDLYGRGRVSNFLRSFNLLNMYLEVDGKRLETFSSVSNFHQQLDMHHASFTTSFDYADKASVQYTYYSLRQLPFTVLMTVNITARKDIDITSASVMQAPDALRDVENYYNEIDRPQALIQLLTSTAKSPTGKLLMCASNSFLFDEPRGSEPKVIHEMWDNNMHLMKFSKHIKAGETYSYAVTGSSVTSAHDPDPLNAAERMTIFAKLQGKEKLIQYHNQAWDSLWSSDIVINGDAQSQQDVHSMLYHLYSFTREGTSYSLSPMGLSGLGYNGHVFWDADLWMFPALLVMHPELAKSMIEYRYERLDAAKRNAFAHGYNGAMYPWESAESGDEETPVWALSGPFEHHITADVALAAWNYYCVTQDTTWLREKGWPILSSTADFWASRVERNGPHHYDINNVVAADEWAENVDNNAYTNGAAIANLKAAITAANILGLIAGSDWQNVADNIPVLKMSNGVTQEYANYKDTGIKQADVNLLAYPLKIITDTMQVRRDLEFYSQRVPDQGTPAMTQGIFALLYSRLGDGAKAFHWFKEAYEPNLLSPFRVIAETKGGTNPYFATGAGGILQAVIMGFGGLDITPQGITRIKTALPPQWKSLTLKGIGTDKKSYVINQH